MRMRQSKMRRQTPCQVSTKKCGSFLILVVLCALTGCGGDAATALPVPTVALIEPTITLTPSPSPPTPTSDPNIDTLVTIDVQPTQPSTALPQDDSPVSIDPVAEELVFIAQRLIADETGLPTRRIQVVSVEAYIWRDSSLGCPLPDQEVTQVETPGYRIVLRAGDNDYLFHTDADRVLRCDPANEILPDTP